jgi:hypothetical protein
LSRCGGGGGGTRLVNPLEERGMVSQGEVGSRGVGVIQLDGAHVQLRGRIWGSCLWNLEMLSFAQFTFICTVVCTCVSPSRAEYVHTSVGYLAIYELLA